LTPGGHYDLTAASQDGGGMRDSTALREFIEETSGGAR
jgi:hypothetical protein